MEEFSLPILEEDSPQNNLFQEDGRLNILILQFCCDFLHQSLSQISNGRDSPNTWHLVPLELTLLIFYSGDT
jgi:hypothetical protein